MPIVTVGKNIFKKNGFRDLREDIKNDIKDSVGRAISMLLWSDKYKDPFFPRIIPKSAKELDSLCSEACQRYNDINGEVPNACESIKMRSSETEIRCKLPRQLRLHSKRKSNSVLIDTYNALMIESSGPRPEVPDELWNERDIFRIINPKKPMYNPFDIPLERTDEIGSDELEKIKKKQEKFLKHPKRLVYSVSDPSYFFRRFGGDIKEDLKDSVYIGVFERHGIGSSEYSKESHIQSKVEEEV